MKNLPTNLPVFPLSNFIIFPKTTVPLNIFEPRYIDMINDSMKSNKFIGMIQPKNLNNSHSEPILHNIGCLGKITSFKETEDGRYLIELKGLIRFKILQEIKNSRAYKEYEIKLTQYAREELDKLSWLSIHGNSKRKGGIFSFTMSGMAHPHDLSTILDRKGVAVRAGQHCAQPLMDHLGIPASCRASFAMYNSENEVDTLVKELKYCHKILN